MGGLVCFLTIMESDWSSVPVADWARDQGRKTEREREVGSQIITKPCALSLVCFVLIVRCICSEILKSISRNLSISQSEKGTEVQSDSFIVRKHTKPPILSIFLQGSSIPLKSLRASPRHLRVQWTHFPHLGIKKV